MKLVFIALGLLFVVLQYELWFAKGGVLTMFQLKHDIKAQQILNKKLADRNKALVADIKDLKNGNQAVEERARDEMGMIKKGETFYQVVNSNDNQQKQ